MSSNSHATEEMKDQLIALTATGIDRRKLQKDQLLLAMRDPTVYDERFAVFINSWEAPTPPVELVMETQIDLSTIRNPAFPSWSRGRVLNGVSEPQILDLMDLPSSAWWHPNQKGDNVRPTGHEVLTSLVSNYIVGGDRRGKTYQVSPTDAINGHHGLKALTWLGQNWPQLPEAFRLWAKGKWLYGWADCVRFDVGDLCVPSLNCSVGEPCVCWGNLVDQWYGIGPALRSQVGTQSLAPQV